MKKRDEIVSFKKRHLFVFVLILRNSFSYSLKIDKCLMFLLQIDMILFLIVLRNI